MNQVTVLWDSLIVKLVNYQLKNCFVANGKSTFSPLESLPEYNNTFENRSPEDFRAYINDLFKDQNSYVHYPWYYSLKKKRKKRYCGGYY